MIALSSVWSCTNRTSEPPGTITPEYDVKTGRLQTLKYDSNGDGKVDMTSTMDGARVVKVEVDTDFDGLPDRWEYYDGHQQIEKVEVSTRRDGKVERTEHYQGGRIARADEDTDGDGKPDKWETYDGDRLAIVAFDTLRRGSPDRRMVYGADGSSRLELDATGNGVWAPR